MAVTFDTTGTSINTQAGTSPLAWTHVNGGTADLILAGFGIDGSSGVTAANNPLTATYNSVSMSTVLDWQSGGSGQTVGYLGVRSLFSPATGSNSVSGSFTTTGTDLVIGGSLSFITGGGSLGTPVHSDSGGAAATSGSITVATTSSSSLVAVFVVNGSGSTAFTSGTSRFLNGHTGTANGGVVSVNAATIAGTGGSVTVNWTQNSDFYAAVAVEVLPGGGGGTAAPAVLYSRPGRTWTRRFHHIQQLPAPPAAPVTSTAVPAPAQRPFIGRRYPSRAVIGCGRTAGAGIAVAAVPNTVKTAERPRITSRPSTRVMFRGFAVRPQQPVLLPRPPPVFSRRVPARAYTHGTTVATTNANIFTALPQHGINVYRRTSARGQWRASSFVTTTNANIFTALPRRAGLPRRYPSRAVWHGTAVSTVNAVPVTSGTFTPSHGINVYRRSGARAIVRGTIISTTNANIFTALPKKPNIYRRTSARAVWHGVVTSNAVPYIPGPQHAANVYRRTTARAVIRGTVTRTTNANIFTKIPQPSPQRVFRRTSARAVWKSSSFVTTTNAHGPSGTIQPRATVPVPRRYPSRARVSYVYGPANAHGPSGAVPPKIIFPRRYPSRVSFRATATKTVNNTLVVAAPQAYQTHVVVARRATARAVIRGTITRTINNTPVIPAPRQRPVITRRVASRAVTRGITAAPLSTPQSRHLPVIPRRIPSRAIWHGTAVRTVNQPYLYVARRPSIPRRAVTRAVWRTVAGTAAAPAFIPVFRSRHAVPLARRLHSRRDPVLGAGPATFPVTCTVVFTWNTEAQVSAGITLEWNTDILNAPASTLLASHWKSMINDSRFMPRDGVRYMNNDIRASVKDGVKYMKNGGYE